MNTLQRKSYAAIYVQDKIDVQRVKDIIRQIDAFEYNYLPEGLIMSFEEYPKVVYTHKFCDLDMDALCARCWDEGVYIWVFNAKSEFPENALTRNINATQ